MLVRPKYKLNPMQEKIIEFKGYNRKPVIDDGEMRDMKNLCSDEYPCLTQRRPRVVYNESYEHPTAIITKDKKLAVISEGKLYYDGVYYPSLKLSDSTQMIPINSKICFFPEKVYLDVVSKATGKLEARHHSDAATVTVTNKTLTVPGADFTKLFKKDDAVQVTATGTGTELLNISARIERVTADKLTFPLDTFIKLIAEGTESKTVAVESLDVVRSCPDLDYVLESNNRLWGVSNKDNTIYACKLGDPTNWTYFQNTSLDSYYAQQGTDGDWTGCAAYSKHLLFFKEDYIHKVYGSNPASYQIETAQCHSLEQGSGKSVAIINDVVIYKSRLGIMAYAGGLPSLISENFGTDRYRNAVAGTDGIKYVVSMLDTLNRPHLLVYDMEKGLWHKEDSMRAHDWCYHDGQLLAINEDDSKIYTIATQKDVIEKEPIEWMAEFGPFDEFIENHKVYSKILMRLVLEGNTQLTVSIKIDHGDWEVVEHINADHDFTQLIPIVPRRCSKFSIKLEGKGRCRIESLVRQYRMGSTQKAVGIS